MQTLVATSPLVYSRDPARRERWLSELATLLSFPTVSAEPQHHLDIAQAAGWLANHLGGIGLHHAQVLPGINGSPPSVYADWLGAAGRPTVLIYGHYDVQPADRRDGWRTPPFRATRIGGDIYARGASDDKGQLFIGLKAVESYLAAGGLPLNIKIWLEGEEEVNSPNIGAVLAREARRLSADAVLISDTFMAGAGRPAIIYGLRGSLLFDLEVRGAANDLHSGAFGGAVPNPIHALSRIIAGLHDKAGRVTIAGFYNDVQKVETGERAELRYGGLSDTDFLANAGVAVGWGERGYSSVERVTVRPAVVVHSIEGGAGGKAIIPARATARIGIRLVPQQEASQLAELVRQHIAANTPPGVQSRLRFMGSAPPVLIPRKHPAMSAAVRAVYKTWGVPPVFTRSGGTIPAVAEFQCHLRAPVILLGFGLPTDNIHAANEHIGLSRLFRGIETIIRFLAEYANDY